MTVSLEHHIEREEAFRLLSEVPRSTFFHTPMWLESLVAAFPAFNGGWITEREGSELVGFMPYIERRKGPFRNQWAMPFGTYGDPITKRHATALRLIEEFFEMSSGWRFWRVGISLLWTEVSSELLVGVKRSIEECSIIKLSGTFDEFKSSIVRKKRRQLHKLPAL